MKHLTLLAALILPTFIAFHGQASSASSTSSAAAAAAAPSSAFATTQVFEHLQMTTVFACGMQDANGMRYGTAENRSVRTEYKFLPSGLVEIQSSDIPGTDKALYTVRGKAVTLKYLDRSGKEISSEVLTLSADGKTLGTLKRVSLKPAAKPANP